MALTEKQKKAIVRSIKESLEPNTWTMWRKSTLSDKEFNVEQKLIDLYSTISKRISKELEQSPEKLKKFEEEFGIKISDNQGKIEPLLVDDILVASAGGNEAVWEALAEFYRKGYLTLSEKVEVKKLRDIFRKSANIRGALWLSNLAKLKEADSGDLDEVKPNKAKEAYLARTKRAEEGNWRASVGKFVEEHGAEISAAASTKSLRNYVNSTMKPAVGPEAQEYLDQLLADCKSEERLLYALYNVTLKGAGLGTDPEVRQRIKKNLPKSDNPEFDRYLNLSRTSKKNLKEDKKFNYREFLTEGYLFKEASESYPKAEAWLQQHPEIKVYTNVSDIADPSEFEDLETDLVEAGYMFISELEAALEGQNYGSESDEDLLASCEKGVINDPNYNPPVSSFNY